MSDRPLNKTITEMPVNSWFAGKTIKKITPDPIVMVDEVVIEFTKGENLHLKLDWRGNECYISQCS